MLGYKMNRNSRQKEEQHPQWKRRLEAKMMATRREVSLLSEIQKVHERLAAQMNQLLRSGTHPKWLTQGQTVLIMKDLQRETIPSSYQTITCLSTTWKLLSSIIAAKVSRHMDQYLSRSRKGISSKNWLLVDRSTKSRSMKLCPAWIHYKKDNDSLPHTWILHGVPEAE